MFKAEDLEGRNEFRSLWKVAARVPWPALLACCLYLPGIVLWAVYSLRCKANTFQFLTTVAPVAQETVDAVTNTVNTTLFTLAAGGTFIFALLLVLAIARSIQRAGVAPNNCCPCARPTPSSYYLYRVFNMGFNIIVYFVNLAILFLMMGAFLWLVVAYAANLSIKGGVRAAADAGIDPVEQVLQANRMFSTVVSDYEKQLQLTPACVVNSTWFKDLNGSISKILEPIPFITNKTLNGTNGTGTVNTLLCPQTCLNLGSFATLFKLQQNCICSSEQLAALQEHSATVSADAGVCLAGVMLIYLACSTLHAYLIGQYVHAGYDYRAAKQRYAELIKQRRRQHALSNSSSLSSNSRRHHKGGGPAAPVIPAGPMHGGPGYLDGSLASVGLNAAEDEEMGLSNGNARHPKVGNGGHVSVSPGGSEIYVSAVSAGAGLNSNPALHSAHSSGNGVQAATAGSRGLSHGAHTVGLSPLGRSSPIVHPGSLAGDAAAAVGPPASLAAVASLTAWNRNQLQQQQSLGPPDDGNTASKQQQQQMVGANSAVAHAQHVRTASKSSAGSIREILSGAVPLEQPSSYQQQQQQQLASVGSGGSAAAPGAVTGRGSSDIEAVSSRLDSSAASAKQHVSHKPTSSSGSYESVIYHSPRNSECGSSGSPSLAVATTGALLDVTPAGLHKMQHRRQQQQQLQHGPAASWSRGSIGSTIQEGSKELPAVAERDGSSAATSAEPSPLAAAAVASTPSPSSRADSNLYNTSGSKASSSADTVGSLTGSGRRQSHRRLPAVDLTNTAHQFMTVEGLEQQQLLQRELSSSMPPAAAAVQQETAAKDLAADAGDRLPAKAARDWPEMGNTPAETSDGTADADPTVNAATADGLEAQPAQAPLPVRRNITMPAHLQLPAQDESFVLDQQGSLGSEQQDGSHKQPQQQYQRAPFVSPLLPPPEQQQLLLQRQQQQLALLLQQEDHQWQQPDVHHQRHWSTPTAAAVAAVTGRNGSTSPGLSLTSIGGLGPKLGLSGYSSASRQIGFRTGSPADDCSSYNTPEPSPLPGGPTPATTPLLNGGYSVLGAFNPSQGNSSAASSGAAAPLFGAGSVSSNSSFSNPQTGLPGSSLMSSFNGGLTPFGVSTPRSLPGTAGTNSNMSSPAGLGAAALQHSSSIGSNGLPVSSLGGLGGYTGLPPTIPEVSSASGYGLEGVGDLPGQQRVPPLLVPQQAGTGGYAGSDVASSGSPLERRRSGYRSSMRKGLMAYDQYKHRQRYQQEVSSPLDPRTELSRRYRNRVPAV